MKAVRTALFSAAVRSPPDRVRLYISILPHWTPTKANIHCRNCCAATSMIWNGARSGGRREVRSYLQPHFPRSHTEEPSLRLKGCLLDSAALNQFAIFYVNRICPRDKSEKRSAILVLRLRVSRISVSFRSSDALALPPSRPCYAKPGCDWRHIRGGLVRLTGLDRRTRCLCRTGSFGTMRRETHFEGRNIAGPANHLAFGAELIPGLLSLQSRIQSLDAFNRLIADGTRSARDC